MTNATLVKSTRYASLLGCGMLPGVAVTVLVLEGATAAERPGVCSRPAGRVCLLHPVIGAVFLPTLVAVAMLAIHAGKAQIPTLPSAVIALIRYCWPSWSPLLSTVPSMLSSRVGMCRLSPRTGRAYATAGRSPVPYGLSRLCSHSATSARRFWIDRTQACPSAPTTPTTKHSATGREQA